MNPAGTIRVVAPSRLHFGMFSFGNPRRRQFGGLGAMIDAPGLALTVSASNRLEATGPLGDRALQFARHVARHWKWDHDPACRIEVERAPEQHLGLGAGTQLGMAVAAGMHALFQRPADPLELARSVQRGQRSAIGLHGFSMGGLLAEAGKWQPDEISPLIARVELPEEWRFVLIQPHAETGLFGAEELTAFEELPAVADQVSAELCRLVLLHLLPAAQEGRFEDFGEQLYRFGHLAGSCFAARQGGPFFSAAAEQLVNRLRAAGIQGVGQSSWGPTLFALLPDESAARSFVDDFSSQPETVGLRLTIAAASNRGVLMERSG